jgi:hypothetical protein
VESNRSAAGEISSPTILRERMVIASRCAKVVAGAGSFKSKEWTGLRSNEMAQAEGREEEAGDKVTADTRAPDRD